MELTERNVIQSLSEIAPYIEADGGFVEFVEIEEDTKFVKVRLGGACTSCAMSAMTLKQGIQNKIFKTYLIVMESYRSYEVNCFDILFFTYCDHLHNYETCSMVVCHNS